MDNIHIGYFDGGWKTPAASHGNGTLVDVFHPAKPGEELVIYATGLGYVSPAVPAGTLAPSPAPQLTEQLFLNFEYRANANGYIPALTVRGISPEIPPAIAALLPKPLFGGMVPGSVGAYQINFVVPQITSPVPNCDQYSIVSSNLTITVFSGISSDSVGICVDASAGPASARAN